MIRLGAEPDERIVDVREPRVDRVAAGLLDLHGAADLQRSCPPWVRQDVVDP